MKISNMRDVDKQNKTAVVDINGFWPWQNNKGVKVDLSRGFCGITKMWHLAGTEKLVKGYPETHDELDRLWKSFQITPESIKPTKHPKWANWICFDNAQRKWVWHKEKPFVEHEVMEFGVCWWWSTNGKFKYASDATDETHDDWRDTLERLV